MIFCWHGIKKKQGWEMSILSEALHDSNKVAFIASMVVLTVGLTGAAVTLCIGWRQTKAAQAAAEASKRSSDAAMLTAENAGSRQIATMRLEWIQTLRKTLSEFHSILMTASEPYSTDDHRKLSDLGTAIDLLLNRDDPDQLALWEITDKIYETDSIDERNSLDASFVAAGRTVMKKEWEKIKAEIRGGATNTLASDGLSG
jgi:hypothetical protein